MKVVFTGPATGLAGEALVREDLIAACIEAGITVLHKVDNQCDVLVASRFDTVKAKNAAKLGIELQSYEHFLTNLFIELGHDIVPAKKSKKKADPYVDGPIAQDHQPNDSEFGDGL